MLIQLKDKIHKDDVWKVHLKLERECLRVTDKGTLARNPFKLSVESLFMKTDESKGSIKLITPTYSTSEEVYRFLCALYQIMSLELEDEYLWPQSYLDSVNQEECQARGMNYYFSFNETLFEKLYEVQTSKVDYLTFKDQIYSKVTDYYQMYQEIFTYFLSNLSAESNQMNDFFQNQETKMRLLTMEATEMIHISFPLNPCEIVGIALEDLQFIQLFLLFLLDEAICEPQNQVVKGPLSDQVRQVFNHLQRLNEEFSLGLERILEKKYQQLSRLSYNCSELINPSPLPSNPKVALLNLAKEYKAQMKNKAYALAGFEMLELSTQILIKEAIKHGICVEVLDDADNFIVLKKGLQEEWIQQATKTSLDSYSTVLAMENKVVTKRLLKEKGVSVPLGEVFSSLSQAVASYGQFKHQSIVIKPKSTNFGVGITIIDTLNSKSLFEDALNIAFSHDQEVIIEQFQAGNEYRFLVIENQVIGVLQRIPANIMGDGIHTIEQLIQQKNEHPLRGVNYNRPLEKIKMDARLTLYLEAQQLTLQSIPALGERIQLRENSNISTGGDSVDMTDEMPDYFKEMAIRATQHLNVSICGVDMIIEDYQDEASNYSIIEMNYNPAIHIHTYPLIGKGRPIAQKILQALKFI